MGQDDKLRSVSKFLSYVLRHNPGSIDLTIDKRGWAEVEELVKQAGKAGRKVSLPLIRNIIRSGQKQRFILSEDEQYIRAGYGHSIDVDLQLNPKTPPKVLYHGTAKRNVPAILEEGLKAGNRQFVHLSAEKRDARQVGARHGKPLILLVNAAEMDKQGSHFFQSESEPGIWLTKKVPRAFVTLDTSGPWSHQKLPANH